jgi:hypothetical protein
MILPDPANEAILFASTNSGIFLSPDEGTTWWLSNPIQGGVLASDASGQIIFAGGNHGGLSASNDLGATWRDVQYGIQNVFVGAMAAVARGTTTVVYAGTDAGVFFSPAGSQFWVQSQNFNLGIFEIVPAPGDPNTIYLGTERDGVWKSTTAGYTFSQAATGLLPPQIYGIAESPASPNVLYAATSSGLFVSRNAGAQWYTATAMPLPNVLSVAVDPSRWNVAFFGSSSGTVYKTVDSGYTFFPASTGLPPENIISLKVAPQFVDNIFAVTNAGHQAN